MIARVVPSRERNRIGTRCPAVMTQSTHRVLCGVSLDTFMISLAGPSCTGARSLWPTSWQRYAIARGDRAGAWRPWASPFSRRLCFRRSRKIVKSSDIEGERLDTAEVRSSIARRLGIDVGGVELSDRRVDGVVEMTLDATRGYDTPLTADRLFGWHAPLFPGGRNGLRHVHMEACRRRSGTSGTTTTRFSSGRRRARSTLRRECSGFSRASIAPSKAHRPR